MTVAKTEPAKLLTELVMTTFRLNGAILRAAEGIAEPAGLTPARWQVLGVALDQPKSVSEIARELGLTRQSVQRIADALVAENMAAYADNRMRRLRPIGISLAGGIFLPLAGVFGAVSVHKELTGDSRMSSL